jgi:DNA-binding response OmpR family regulator
MEWQVQKIMRPQSGKRILLVEDDDHVRTLLQHVLLSAGYAIDAAATVAEASILLGNNEYDLVLTDDRLPDGRGIAIADRAHARGIDAVVVTGFALRMAKDELARHDYLIKPVSPAELVGAVERHIGAAATGENR